MYLLFQTFIDAIYQTRYQIQMHLRVHKLSIFAVHPSSPTDSMAGLLTAVIGEATSQICFGVLTAKGMKTEN